MIETEIFTGVNSLNFISMVIKTANQWPDSICGIELIKIEENKETDSFSTFIHTSQSFDPFYTSVHGIEANDVANSPTFEQMIPVLEQWLQNETVLSFHHEFEAQCLNECFEQLGKLKPIFTHYSVLPYFKNKIDESYFSYTLHDLTNHFIQEDVYNDAEKIAKLVVHFLQNETHWTAKLVENTVITQKEIQSIFQKTVVFTGGLSGMRRAEAAKLVMQAGGAFSNTMSKKVDLLVVSNSSFEKFNNNGAQSSKWVKAASLQNAGHEITILTEDEFLPLIK